MESKKVSLKMLTAIRESINAGFWRFTFDSQVKAYITVYGYNVNELMDLNKKNITVVSKLPFYSEKADTNWTYQLVIGYPRKQG